MNAIDEIKTRLHPYPNISWKHEGNSITIFPLDDHGFSVSLVDHSPGYTVYFDSWHEEYEDMEKALDAFAFGLSDDCRLKVGYRGNFAHVWTVEQKDENGEWFGCEWIGLNETGLLIPPLFWLKKRTISLQNKVLKSQ